MVSLQVKTERSYDDEYIDFIRISEDDFTKELGSIGEDEILRTEESGTYEGDYGEVYLPENCNLDLEVVTPEPYISVEVSTREVQAEGVEYGSWTFHSTTEFEVWCEDNDIKIAK